MEKLRLFVAIDLPQEIKEYIGRGVDFSGKEEEGVRWVHTRQLHLTLKFLGHQREELLPGISASLRRIAEEAPPMRLKVDGCGSFPRPEKGRVLWLGIEGDDEALILLAKKIDRAMVKFGIPREKRSFKSHVTLARCQPPRNIATLVKKCDEWLGKVHFEPFLAEEIVLYRSVLSPQGSTYIVMERMALKGRK
jgi:2'-5' RNA ligase